VSPDNAHNAPMAIVTTVLPEWMRLLTICQTQSQEVTHELQLNFETLVGVVRKTGAEPVAATTTEIIEKMRSGFQFQDRQSQILSIVLADLQHFLDTVTQGELSHDAPAWMDRLRSTYVVPELVEGYDRTAQARTTAGDEETTFF
jgi:hypothetical protein